MSTLLRFAYQVPITNPCMAYSLCAHKRALLPTHDHVDQHTHSHLQGGNGDGYGDNGNGSYGNGNVSGDC